MNPQHIIFPVGAGGSSPVAALSRIRLLDLAAAIQQHIGPNPSACWYAVRCQYTHGPSCFFLDIGGTAGLLNLVIVLAPETRLPTPEELARKLPSRTLIVPVADLTDAFYLTLFLFDNLALTPAFDPQGIIVPGNIRYGLGVFSCR